VAGLNLFLCLLITFLLGSGLFISVFRLSDKYGQYGLLKRGAKKYIPSSIRSKSRKIFFQLNYNENYTSGRTNGKTN